jgi:pyruvate/2-oxoglutarate dehydrogenase complex dihydrolipoamide dehydrogenase (E3) component
LTRASISDEAKRVPGAAEAVQGPLDTDAVLARRDQIINNLDDSNQTPWLAERGVTLIRGHGRLEGERTVRVGDERYRARTAVVLATGSDAAIPPIPGLREARPWTNRQATTARRIPDSLVILGGGAAGVELAQAYASLGSLVTVIEAENRLLPREEPFASEQIAQALRQTGVELHLGVRAQAVTRTATGAVEVSLSAGAAVRAEELLVAIGRSPRTHDLGLETVGLQTGAYVEVDERLRVPSLPWLYAIGDVNGRALLTHMGKHQAHVL